MTDYNNELEESILLEDLAPMANKKAAVVIGRFNPPTKGHYAVIDSVKAFIRKNKEMNLYASPIVVIIGGSKSDEDKKKNPLTVSQREAFMKASGHTNGVIFMSAPNAFAAFAKLREEGFEPIAIAAGTDRANDYIRMLDKHFVKPDGSAIKHIKIHLKRDETAIEKDKDAKKAAMDSALETAKSEGSEIETDAISASLARRAVELGYEEEFAQIVGLENKPILAKKMFKAIKNSLGG